jgi:hypothetical protein
MEKTRLKVRVTPRSSRNQVVGWQEDVLRIKLTAPPVEGAANRACIEFLAELLGVSKSQITLVSGAASREKAFEIEGISPNEVRRRLIY